MAFWDNIFKGDDSDSDELFRYDELGNPGVDIGIDDDDDDMDDIDPVYDSDMDDDWDDN